MFGCTVNSIVPINPSANQNDFVLGKWIIDSLSQRPEQASDNGGQHLIMGERRGSYKGGHQQAYDFVQQVLS